MSYIAIFVCNETKTVLLERETFEICSWGKEFVRSGRFGCI